MKKLIISLIFLLTVALSFSQKDYPKLTLIGEDTLVLFTPNQVDKMNLTFVYLDEQLELNSSYKKELLLFNDRFLILNKQYNTCEEKSILLVKVADERLNQIKILTEENKKQDKTIKFLKKSRNLYSIGGVVVGGLITYFLSQILNK